ncbi:MAG: hypothetical protein IOMNBAOH_00228 [Rhodocyclaceae bacterium]|jgi:hypothetical protein|nr:hypothetical protein [Rhodocyclaceae bacterium]
MRIQWRAKLRWLAAASTTALASPMARAHSGPGARHGGDGFDLMLHWLSQADHLLGLVAAIMGVILALGRWRRSRWGRR